MDQWQIAISRQHGDATSRAVIIRAIPMLRVVPKEVNDASICAQLETTAFVTRVKQEFLVETQSFKSFASGFVYLFQLSDFQSVLSIDSLKLLVFLQTRGHGPHFGYFLDQVVIRILVCVVPILTRFHQLCHFIYQVLVCLELVHFVGGLELGLFFPRLCYLMSQLLDWEL